ncbi:MAG: tetratricopeptide repeat protein [Planctomycetes bacterium]|nr:tetratricopeptide repeat protein [Planctomycetota bacterium]
MPSTFVCTDIQGSTSLWERLGPAFAPVLAEHNRILREAIREFGGAELRTEGDSFLVRFADSASAVRFSLAAQERLHAARWPEETGEILVRIGVQAGDPERAHAVAAAAHGGQTLLSEAAARDAGESLAGADVQDLGPHGVLPSLPPERLFQALPRALSVRRFPPPRTLSTRATNLPVTETSFVGRRAELAELLETLPRPEGRLVTLTGPGGIGKTRLALEAATALLDRFEGGCWYVDAAEARGAHALAHRVAAAFGAPPGGREDPIRAVAGVLEFRKPVLLVLDSFEHLVEHAMATIGVWKQRAPRARFLVASRVVLGLAGERELPLPPLPVPTRTVRPAEISSYDAVRLFTERARAAAPGFEADPEDLAQVCRDLEGIPLAIEVAAAALRATPLKEIAARHAEGLAGALDWTWERLAPAERAALALASVFRGGFFLESAEAVIDLSAEPDAPFALDAVQTLRERSLVRTHDTKYGMRFGLFRSIREFAAARLPDPAPVLARHAGHFVAYGETWSARVSGPQAVEALDRLELETENLFLAQDTALAAGDAETAARAILAVSPALAARGPAGQRAPRLEAALAAGPATPVHRARLPIALAKAHFLGQDWNRAADLLAQGKAAAEAAGLRDWLGMALKEEGVLRFSRGEHAAALDALRRAEAIAREIGNDALLEDAIGNRGNVHRGRSEFDEAVACLREAEALAARRGDASAEARHLGNRAIVHKRRGEYAEAEEGYLRAEKIYRALGDRRLTAVCLGNLGTLFMDRGEIDRGLACFEEAEEIDRHLGCKPDVAVDLANRGGVYHARGDFPRALACLDESAAHARDLGMTELLAYTLGIRGGILSEQGATDAALAALTEAESLARSAGSREQTATYATFRARALARAGRFDEARAPLLESKKAHEDLASTRSIHYFHVLALLARTESKLGRKAEAVALAREAVALAEALGFAEGKGDREGVEAMRALRGMAGP